MKKFWYVIGLIVDLLIIAEVANNILAGKAGFVDYYALAGFVIIALPFTRKISAENTAGSPKENTTDDEQQNDTAL